jgi:hypothetical protein
VETHLLLPSENLLNLSELSQAWEFLSSLSDPKASPYPPQHLRHLSLPDWIAIRHLLELELEKKEQSNLH